MWTFNGVDACLFSGDWLIIGGRWSGLLSRVRGKSPHMKTPDGFRRRPEGHADDIGEFASSYADSHTDIYTQSLFQFYADHSGLFYLIDDEVEERGAPSAKDGSLIIKLLQMGQYKLLYDFAVETVEEFQKQQKPEAGA